MIEELKAVLDLLGDVTGIAGWILFGWLTVKLVILLSTTGAIVYCIKIGLFSVKEVIEKGIDANLKKHAVPKRKEITDVKISDLCITVDGTYENIIHSLRVVRDHMNQGGGKYIHSDGADWLSDAIKQKIMADAKKESTISE